MSFIKVWLTHTIRVLVLTGQTLELKLNWYFGNKKRVFRDLKETGSEIKGWTREGNTRLKRHWFWTSDIAYFLWLSCCQILHFQCKYNKLYHLVMIVFLVCDRVLLSRGWVRSYLKIWRSRQDEMNHLVQSNLLVFKTKNSFEFI